LAGAVSAQAGVKAGFALADVTPKVDGASPVYIAGYGQNRKATGVHDPLFVRTIVLEEDGAKIAMVGVDVVGLQYPAVEKIREKIKGFSYVLIASTHNHEGPDVVGLWGPSPTKSGVDPAFLQAIEDKVIETIAKADASKVDVSAVYGTADDKTLMRDSRKPIVYDDVVRCVKFTNTADGKPAGVIVQWGCHPESLGSENTLLTADFPSDMIKIIEKKYGCPVVYFSSAVGGLMAPPHALVDDAGKEHHDGNFEYCRIYGEKLARLVEKALGSAEAVNLSPFKLGYKKLGIPLENPTYHLMWSMGALNRDAFQWKDDPYDLGPSMRGSKIKAKGALKTEVCYLGLGDLHVAGIPGELYPEMLYGKYQEPADPAADFPDAPLEPSVVSTLPGPKFLFIGLANDEVGYILPLRQWDWKAPFTYGSKSRHYGEINSVGSQSGPILMKGLVDAVKSAAPAASSASR
jgi:hypothetical protein